jgi:hypothetical protein
MTVILPAYSCRDHKYQSQEQYENSHDDSDAFAPHSVL